MGGEGRVVEHREDRLTAEGDNPAAGFETRMLSAALNTSPNVEAELILPVALESLPTLNEQADRLISLGIHELGRLYPTQIRTAVSGTDADNALLVVHPDRVAASVLAPFLKHSGKSGFVVEDMADVDQFIPIDMSAPPTWPLYLVHDISRGDEMADWSPTKRYRQSPPLRVHLSPSSKVSTGCFSSPRPWPATTAS